MRQLLSRLEDEKTGKIKVTALHTKVPKYRVNEMKRMLVALKGEAEAFPWHNQMEPVTHDLLEGETQRTWGPTLSIVGSDGIPAIKDGGNVLRPYTALKLSFRLPPDIDCYKAMGAVNAILEKNPPYNASIAIDWEDPGNGWHAPKLSPWLDNSIQEASNIYYNKPALSIGEGGSIPFMAMLGEKFPDAQFVITGVLGPGSNAHGPNEFLHIPYGKKLSACVGFILNQFPS
jgi:acetylornithine deacetylase/succinyl-diaminopimelate desuccinylase-like protein